MCSQSQLAPGRQRVVIALAVWVSTLAVSVSFGKAQSPRAPGAPSAPEARAISFLAVEVPKWRREHPCYSCHNNGDAARALIAAGRAGVDVDRALMDTLEWLRQPSRWEHNAGRGDASDDRTLARIQFAGALAAAVDGGLAAPATLAEAAGIVAADQQPDGSWRLDASQSLGSPATYGLALAASSARHTLASAQQPRLQAAVARADRWLREFDVKSVLDSAAVILGLALATDVSALEQRRRSLTLVDQGEAPNGGWGPYVTSAPEPFDTAVVVLALSGLAGQPELAHPTFSDDELREAIARGRRFLVDRQIEDGSWPETTRPAGQESYAQRISTTGWATLALFASRGVSGR